jgi:hypothetical protein
MRKTVSELGGVVPSANEWGRKCYKPSATFLTTVFGSWNSALISCGFTPKAEMKSEIEEKDVINAFRNYFEQHGVRPKVEDWNKKDLQPTYTQIIGLYDSWDAALRASDLNVSATEEECIQSLRNFKRDNGSFPSIKEWNDGDYWPSVSQIIRIFKKWSTALNMAKNLKENDKNDKTDKNSTQLMNFELVLPTGDKCNIPVRQDGFVDLTLLARAGNHRLDHYMKSEKTKAFIKAFSSYSEYQDMKIVQISRVGKTQHTFGHRLLAYNYAQYISPNFAAQICLAGSTCGKDKSAQDLDSIWKEKYEKLKIKSETLKTDNKIKDEKIKTLVRDNTQLKTRNEKLKMKRSHPQLEEGYCIYCHHDDERAQTDRFKIGKTKDINGVLKSARRNAPHTLLDFIMYLDEDSYSLIETAMKRKFIEQRKPRSHELFTEELDNLRKGAIEICNVLNVVYRFAEPDAMEIYNQFIIEDTSAGEDIDNESSDEKTMVESETVNNNDEKEPQACENIPINNINVNVNIRVDLSELKNLLKDLESFTNKRLDSLLNDYDIPKHGNKAKKIEKLKTYINDKLSEKN